jgi:DNA-binding NarL/FixJ family response regulator
MMLRPIRVFIVDDHPLVREWLGNLLRLEEDIEVVGEADEPESAMAAISNMAAMPEAVPDVVVVDLSLKRGSGLDLIKAICASGDNALSQSSRQTNIRALVLSMHEEVGDVERALKAGARGYVMKRESTSQIVNAIRQVHSGKIFLAPEVAARLAERVDSYAQNPAASPDALSDRELEVFRRIGMGHSTRRIAEDLGVGQKTIQTYCARIKEKMGLNDGSELLRSAVQAHEREQQ